MQDFVQDFVQDFLEHARFIVPLLMPILGTVFVGGVFACGRRNGGGWLRLLALGGVLSCGIIVGMQEMAVPLWIGFGFLAVLTVVSVAAVAVPLIRGKASSRGRSGPSNRQRIASGFYAVFGALLTNFLLYTILWFPFLKYPDFAPAGPLLGLSALIASPVGATLGWKFGELRIAKTTATASNVD